MDIKIDNFEDFSPIDYLQEYYSTLEKENIFLLNFFHNTYYRFPTGGTLIEVGGGPTLYQLISASEKVSSITFTEFHRANRQACELWLKKDKGAFNWDPFLEYVKDLEGVNTIEILEERMREKINRILPCNLFSKNPIDSNEKFDIVSMNFCAESITNTEEDFKKTMDNCLSLLKEGGRVVMTFLAGANYYRVGKRHFPAYPLTKDYLLHFLEKEIFAILK